MNSNLTEFFTDKTAVFTQNLLQTWVSRIDLIRFKNTQHEKAGSNGYFAIGLFVRKQPAGI